MPVASCAARTWYFGKVIVKYSAQNSTGMCCGQECSRGFRCQSLSICCSNLEAGFIYCICETSKRRYIIVLDFISDFYTYPYLVKYFICARQCTKFLQDQSVCSIWALGRPECCLSLCRSLNCASNGEEKEWGKAREGRIRAACFLGVMYLPRCLLPEQNKWWKFIQSPRPNTSSKATSGHIKFYITCEQQAKRPY